MPNIGFWPSTKLDNGRGDRVRIGLEELHSLLDEVAEREGLKPILLLELGGLILFARESVTDKTELQIQIVRVFRPKLATPRLVIEIDNLFDGVADKIVVQRLVIDDHIGLINGSIGRCGGFAFCGLPAGGGSVSSTKHLGKLRLVVDN